MHLLLAIMACCGCRKGEVLDPKVIFYTYKDTKEGKSSAFRVVPDAEHSIAIDSEKDFDEEIGFEFMLVQVGVLKDKSQAINRFLTSAEDTRFVTSRILISAHCP